MSGVADLARRLAREAEAVCRHYLPRGHRAGGYWIAGDVTGTPGRSLYVRLHGPEYGKGAAGHWTDAATGEHGDLLDLIARNRDLEFGHAMDEARRFLSLPYRSTARGIQPPRVTSPELARLLFAAGTPIAGTLAETYLRGRGITAAVDTSSLRYHPSLAYRENPTAPRQHWPALLAAVTDLAGTITGVQRSWLDPSTAAKAPLVDPRRALGHLLGHGVRFGRVSDVMVAGEGIETMLSLNSVLPSLPMVAALSANHLAALKLPASLRRLYIALDHDDAGRNAAFRLRHAADPAIEVRLLTPLLEDFNIDLQQLAVVGLRAYVAGQLAIGDLERFT